MKNISFLSPDKKVDDREARYRLSLHFVELLEQVEIGLHGRRLALGIAHAVCRETPDWHNGTAVQPVEGYRVRAKELRGRLGLEGSKGNRDLEKGLAELLDVRLLAQAELMTGRQWLNWTLTDYTYDSLFKPKPYGLFDIRHARNLTTPLHHLVYNRIGVVRRCDTPMITFSVDACAATAGRSSDWGNLRPSMFGVLVQVARLFDLRLMVGCECRGMRVGIDHLTVMLFHSKTVWRASSLRKLPATTRKVFAVDGQGAQELKAFAA